MEPLHFGPAHNCALYRGASVTCTVEVKTTLTNQGLCKTYEAVKCTADIPCIIFALDSQMALKGLDTDDAPSNVKGIFTLSHGCRIFRKTGELRYVDVHPGERVPLCEFYRCVVSLIKDYAAKTNFDRLARAFDAADV